MKHTYPCPCGEGWISASIKQAKEVGAKSTDIYIENIEVDCPRICLDIKQDEDYYEAKVFMYDRYWDK